MGELFMGFEQCNYSLGDLLLPFTLTISSNLMLDFVRVSTFNNYRSFWMNYSNVCHVIGK